MAPGNSRPWGAMALRRFAVAVLTIGQSSVFAASSGPNVSIAADTFPVSQPRQGKPNYLDDGMDRVMTYPFARTFDVARYLRLLAHVPLEAADVDEFDKVPNSAWYTGRIGEREMSSREIAQGPDTMPGPDTAGVVTIIKAKNAGAVPGFFIKDRRNDVYQVKLDYTGFPGLQSGAEAINTRLLYAAGYNVPANYATMLDTHKLRLAPDITFFDARRRLKTFTRDVLDSMLSNSNLQPDGRVRVVASRWLTGIPLGGWSTAGVRADDPDDRIPHERRRELRGLRVVAGWINWCDLNIGNMLDVYDANQRFVKHYLVDFHYAMGSGTVGPLAPQEGHEPYFGVFRFLWNVVALGFYTPSWERAGVSPFPSVGRWGTAGFDPDRYRPLLPTPPFEDMTDRDAYWGARIVASFTDEQVDAAVRSGWYFDPAAEVYVAKVFKERRDIISRRYFGRISPLEAFVSTKTDEGGCRLDFTDLAVKYRLAGPTDRRYRYAVCGRRGNKWRVCQGTSLALDRADFESNGKGVSEVMVGSSRIGSSGWCRPVRLFLHATADGGVAIVGLVR
jgi:hypothetical protein